MIWRQNCDKIATKKLLKDKTKLRQIVHTAATKVYESSVLKMWRFKQNWKDEDLLLGACAFVFLSSSNVVKKKRKRFWMRPSLRKRDSHSINELIDDLREDDIGLSGEIRSSFKNFLRMSSEDFENLICLIGPAVAKRHTNYRNAISVTERVAITLRFLATGDSYRSISYLSKVSTQSISVIVPEVCEVLITSLSGYLKVCIAFFYNYQ